MISGASGRCPRGRVSKDQIAAVVLLIAALLIRVPTLAFPIVERHAWRQTQTAFTATVYAEEGIDLLHPQVPVLGPPFTMTLEFPLYQAVAALLIDAGLQMEIALRGLSLVAFLGTAAVLWLLLRRHVNPRTALIGLVLFAFSPFAILWSRTSMIEYPATVSAVVFMLGTLEWHAGHGRRWFLVAAVGGSVAALVKITTAMFWVAPALLTRRWRAVLLCAIPGSIGLAWTVFAQVERAETPLVSGLTGDYWLEWNLGGDRLDLATWGYALSPLLALAGLLLAPFAILVIHRSERLIWAWFAIALVGPLLLFTRLYALHDYYAIAVTPALAALIAAGLDTMLERAPHRLATAGIGFLAIVAVVATSSYWLLAYSEHDPEGVLEGAAIVRAATPDDEFVDLGCADWHPGIMFYAQRKGFAMGGDGTFNTVDDPRVCIAGAKARG